MTDKEGQRCIFQVESTSNSAAKGWRGHRPHRHRFEILSDFEKWTESLSFLGMRCFVFGVKSLVKSFI